MFTSIENLMLQILHKNRFKKLVIICTSAVFILFSLTSNPLSSEDKKNPSVKDIMEKSENIRTPADSFSVDINAYEFNEVDKKIKSTMKFKLRAKTGEKNKSLVTFLAPPNQRGRMLLLNDNIYWLYIPGTRHPIRISPQQKLFGNVSYGDVISINFKYDYDYKYLKDETIDNKEYFVIQLTANKKSASYQRVIYWVEKESYRPYKAEYYAISGRLLKTLLFTNYIKIFGKMRPAKHIITDKLNPDKISIIAYENFEKSENPDSIFQRDYLLKVK